MSNNLIDKLVEQLDQIPAAEHELQALEATGKLKSVMSLAEILQYQEILTAAYQNDSSELVATERIVRKCLNLPAVPLTKLVVANPVSDADGFYRIELPPGSYTLIPSSSEFMQNNPIGFTVSAGELTYIPIIYPSMIP